MSSNNMRNLYILYRIVQQNCNIAVTDKRLTKFFYNDNILFVKAMTWTCPDITESAESFWLVKKSDEDARVPPYQQTQRTVYGQDRYILKSGRFYLQFGWNRGVIVHLIPFGMKVFFVFIGKPHPDSQIITHHILRKVKGRLLW